MHLGQSARGSSSPYSDYSLRFAKAINNRFAFKIGAQYTRADDWLASDSSNYDRSGNSGRLMAGNRHSDPNYDGVNVYGDETSGDIRPIIYGIAQQYPEGSPQRDAINSLANSMKNPTPVSRTGYKEKDMIDPETKNIKLSGALHYKIKDNLEDPSRLLLGV